MTNPEVYAIAGALIVGLGIHGVMTRPHVLRKLAAVNVTGAGVFLILVAIAARASAPAGPDPVPHAMVLTGIVIAVSFTAVGVVLAVRIASAERGQAEDGGDGGEDA